MTSVDKAAVGWSIAIVAVAVGIAGAGMQGALPEIGVSTPSPTVPVMEPTKTTTKTIIPGYERLTSVIDPGIGHETHQLAIILAPSKSVYTGTLRYDASEPIQLVSLVGPLGPGETAPAIWTPDGTTKFALTFVDPKKSSGEWEFSGNALAVHTMKTTPFIVDYKITNLKEKSVGVTVSAPKVTEPPKMTTPMTAKVSMPSGTSVPGCEETNACYMPATVSIQKGGTVTWSNDDTAAHTVTSGSPKSGPDQVFDSSLVLGGKTYAFTFQNTGSYDYFCMVHPWMTGKVQVG
jgi:plastocyanin